MIPHGPLYLRIREDVLDTFPGTRLDTSRTRTPPFSDWLLNSYGSFSVPVISNSRINLHASPVDLSSSIALEVELLTNNCFEHSAELIACARDMKDRSDAWNVVTIYYFGFFAASIFLRLVGQPLLYADRARISALKQMASSGTSSMAPGAYSVYKVSDLSATISEYSMQKRNLKIHEGTWNRLFSYFENLLQDAALRTVAQEVLFFQALSQHSLDAVYGAGWPSNVRNKANYRPGKAYRRIEQVNDTKSRLLINAWNNLNENKLVNLLTASSATCSPVLEQNFAQHISFMFSISQSLFLLTRELYNELIQRRIVATTWEHRRKNFATRQDIPEDLASLLPVFSIS